MLPTCTHHMQSERVPSVAKVEIASSDSYTGPSSNRQNKHQNCVLFG
jgi:hypothetical protein